MLSPEAQPDSLLSPTEGCPPVLYLASRFPGSGREREKEGDRQTEIETDRERRCHTSHGDHTEVRGQPQGSIFTAHLV